MAQVIKVRCDDKRAVFFIRDDDGNISSHDFKSYKSRCSDRFFAIDEYYELYYESYAICPLCLLELGRIAPGMTTHSEKQTANFDMALSIAQRAKNGGQPMPQQAAIKALMLFNADENTASYDKDVYMWDSVDGVQRCSFDAYLRQIEGAHEGTYKLVKLSMLRVQGIALADFKYLKKHSMPADGDKSETTKMVFRSLWYAATGEEMPI